MKTRLLLCLCVALSAPPSLGCTVLLNGLRNPFSAAAIKGLLTPKKINKIRENTDSFYDTAREFAGSVGASFANEVLKSSEPGTLVVIAMGGAEHLGSLLEIAADLQCKCPSLCTAIPIQLPSGGPAPLIAAIPKAAKLPSSQTRFNEVRGLNN